MEHVQLFNRKFARLNDLYQAYQTRQLCDLPCNCAQLLPTTVTSTRKRVAANTTPVPVKQQRIITPEENNPRQNLKIQNDELAVNCIYEEKHTPLHPVEQPSPQVTESDVSTASSSTVTVDRKKRRKKHHKKKSSKKRKAKRADEERKRRKLEQQEQRLLEEDDHHHHPEDEDEDHSAPKRIITLEDAIKAIPGKKIITDVRVSASARVRILRKMRSILVADPTIAGRFRNSHDLTEVREDIHHKSFEVLSNTTTGPQCNICDIFIAKGDDRCRLDLFLTKDTAHFVVERNSTPKDERVDFCFSHNFCVPCFIVYHSTCLQGKTPVCFGTCRSRGGCRQPGTKQGKTKKKDKKKSKLRKNSKKLSSGVNSSGDEEEYDREEDQHHHNGSHYYGHKRKDSPDSGSSVGTSISEILARKRQRSDDCESGEEDDEDDRRSDLFIQEEEEEQSI
jgi:hypothetical protein